MRLQVAAQIRFRGVRSRTAASQAASPRTAQHPLAAARGSEHFSEPRLVRSGWRTLPAHRGGLRGRLRQPSTSECDGFVSGHDFSRADTDHKTKGFSPCEWQPVRNRRSRRATRQPEGRKIVAHGASRGKATKRRISPGRGGRTNGATCATCATAGQGLKPCPICELSARLKSCPDTKHNPQPLAHGVSRCFCYACGPAAVCPSVRICGLYLRSFVFIRGLNGKTGVTAPWSHA